MNDMESAALEDKTNGKKAKSQLVYYINSFIGLFFMFGFRFLPPPSPMNEVGMQVAGVFIGLIFMWSTVDLIWPSIVGIIAFGLTDYITIGGAIQAGLGSEIMWQLVIIMMLAQVMKVSGVGEFIARWLITRKALNGKPLLFTFVLLWGFFIVTPMIDCFATVYLGWTIIFSIADLTGFKRNDRYIKFLLMGAHLAAIMGGGVLPFQGWMLALSEVFRETTGVQINYGLFIVFTIIISTIILLLITLSYKLLKIDMSKLNEINVEELKDPKLLKMTGRQKTFVGAFLCIIIFVISTTMLPQDWVYVKVLNFITTSGIFGLIMAALCFIRPKGVPLVNFAEIGEKGFNFNVVFICAAAIPVASALTNQATGVRDLLFNILSPLLDGRSPLIFIAMICFIMLLLTNMGSNIGTAMLMIPVVVPFVDSIGINPAIPGMALLFIANLGFILPGSSAMAPLLYSSEDIEVRDIYKIGLWECAIFLIVAIPAYYILSMII